MKFSRLKRALLPTLTLFSSLSTLLCCALPALFVALGAGATLAGVVTQVPGLIWVSKHKPLVFGFAAGMLMLAGFLRYRSRNDPCPIDPEQAVACKRLRRMSGVVYWSSVFIALVGAYFAFVHAHVLVMFR